MSNDTGPAEGPGWAPAEKANASCRSAVNTSARQLRVSALRPPAVAENCAMTRPAVLCGVRQSPSAGLIVSFPNWE